MIVIETNADEIAEALATLKRKSIISVRRRAMKRAVVAGHVFSSKKLRQVMKAPKDKRWPKYFKQNTKRVVRKTNGDQAEGYLQYSSRKRGLKNYTTTGRLRRHREQANRHRAQSRRPNPRYATPLVFDLIPGKKTRLERTFVGRGTGKTGLQVFTRPRDGGKLHRPSGPSLAGQLRSQRNANIKALIIKKLRGTFIKEYRDTIRFKFRQLVKRANKRIS